MLRVSETEGVRDGVVGGLMEMVSFPVEEGWETERFHRRKSLFETAEEDIPP